MNMDDCQKMVDKQNQKSNFSMYKIYPQVFIFEDLLSESLKNLERQWPELDLVIAKNIAAKHIWRVSEYHALIKSLENFNK